MKNIVWDKEYDVVVAGDGGALDVLSDADDSVDFGTGWEITGTEVRDDRFFRIIQPTVGGNAIVNSSGPFDWQNPLLKAAGALR